MPLFFASTRLASSKKPGFLGKGRAAAPPNLKNRAAISILMDIDPEAAVLIQNVGSQGRIASGRPSAKL